jgi:hypothetical protein
MAKKASHPRVDQDLRKHDVSDMAVSAAEPGGLWVHSKKLLQAVRRWPQQSWMPVPMNSSKRSSLKSRPRKDAPPLRERYSSASLAPSLLKLQRVRSVSSN